MDDLEFPMLVRKYFDYLTDQYKYSVTDKPYGKEPFDYGILGFQSPKTMIEVVKDRSGATDFVYVLIKPADAPQSAKLSLTGILDALEIPYSVPDSIEGALKEYAQWLKEYCAEFIQGDFSRWSSVLRHFVERMKKHYRSHGSGRELPNEAYQDIEDYIKEMERNRK